MHAGASCNSSDENSCAEGCHEAKTWNGRARETDARRHGKPRESGNRRQALIIMEDVVGIDSFS